MGALLPHKSSYPGSGAPVRQLCLSLFRSWSSLCAGDVFDRSLDCCLGRIAIVEDELIVGSESPAQGVASHIPPRSRTTA
jgi:hypothetical protein